MIRLELTADLDQLGPRLGLLTGRQIQFAAARSMTATVQHAAEELKQSMARTTGGPIQGGATRWTLGAVRSKWARPDNLVAEVGFLTGQPRAAGRYLQPLIRGGDPKTKGVDVRTAAEARAPGTTVVPSRAMRRDARGNVTRASMARILGEAAKAPTPGGRYFIARMQKNGGEVGVFARTARATKGRPWSGTTRLFTLDKDPRQRRATWKPQAELFKSAEEFFPGHYRASLLAELRRAGFR
jgi:hypothetical protein